MKRNSFALKYLSILLLCVFSKLSGDIYANTAANTLIQNTATVSYNVGVFNDSVTSNTTTFQVDELILFTLVANNASGVTVQTPHSQAALSFTLSNLGNGNEGFSLGTTQLTTDNFNASSLSIYLDSNNNGIFEPSLDALYLPGINDPILSSGSTLNIFVVGDIPPSLNISDEALVHLSASSLTGTGPVTSLYAGLGDGGVDALMGSQGGNIFAPNKYVVAPILPSLTKTQSILDPNGTHYPIQNAIITYTLTLTVSGSGSLSNLHIADNIPSGTSYVPNSLKLGTTSLSDSVDADAGFFDGTKVDVVIPTATAPSTYTVMFKVKIL